MCGSCNRQLRKHTVKKGKKVAGKPCPNHSEAFAERMDKAKKEASDKGFQLTKEEKERYIELYKEVTGKGAVFE